MIQFSFSSLSSAAVPHTAGKPIGILRNVVLVNLVGQKNDEDIANGKSIASGETQPNPVTAFGVIVGTPTEPMAVPKTVIRIDIVARRIRIVVSDRFGRIDLDAIVIDLYPHPRSRNAFCSQMDEIEENHVVVDPFVSRIQWVAIKYTTNNSMPYSFLKYSGTPEPAFLTAFSM
jgi:hypothetical protein